MSCDLWSYFTENLTFCAILWRVLACRLELMPSFGASLRTEIQPSGYSQISNYLKPEYYLTTFNPTRRVVISQI